MIIIDNVLIDLGIEPDPFQIGDRDPLHSDLIRIRLLRKLGAGACLQLTLEGNPDGMRITVDEIAFDRLIFVDKGDTANLDVGASLFPRLPYCQLQSRFLQALPRRQANCNARRHRHHSHIR